MTDKELIIELLKELYTLKNEYKEQEKEKEKYKDWWLEALNKLEEKANSGL